MAHRIPESFYIYQELVTKLAQQQRALKQHYEMKIADLDDEMRILKQQIESQNTMLNESKAYIELLESKLNKVATIT